MKTSVFILEGNPIVRLWLSRLLHRSPAFQIVGTSGTARDALLHFPRGHSGPELLLIGHCSDCDYGLNTTLGLFRLLHPRTRIVLLASAPFMLRKDLPVLRKPFSPVQLRRLLAQGSG